MNLIDTQEIILDGLVMPNSTNKKYIPVIWNHWFDLTPPSSSEERFYKKAAMQAEMVATSLEIGGFGYENH